MSAVPATPLTRAMLVEAPDDLDELIEAELRRRAEGSPSGNGGPTA